MDRLTEPKLKEHKNAALVGDNNFKVAQHANQFVRPTVQTSPDHATVVDKAHNFHERLFLEAWHSQRNKNAEMSTLTPRMFTNPLCNHAQRSLVVYFAGVVRA